MSIGESTVRISRLQRKVIKSCEGLLGDTTKFPHDEAVGLRKLCNYRYYRVFKWSVMVDGENPESR